MAQTTQKDVITRLTEAISDLPGSAKLTEAVQGVRDRVDELQRRVRSLDPLERRVTELERRLDELTKKSAAGTTSKRTPAAKKSAS